MIKPRPFKKSFSAHLNPNSHKDLETYPKGAFFRREALRLSPIPQLENEENEEILNNNLNQDSFEKSLYKEDDETLNMRKKIYEDMSTLLNYKEMIKPNHFIFAREKELDDNSSIEDKEEDKLDYVAYYEKKYDDFQRDNDNQDNLYTMKKDQYELLKYYGDPYICLDLRKKLLFIKYFISHIALQITQNAFFDYFMLIVISFNCILLAMEDPQNPNQTLVEIDNLLIIIYTIEMALKMLSLGLFFDKFAYFRGGWNILDFVIVVTSYIPIFFSTQSRSFNLSSIRTLRVLRPLRTITSIKSLRVLMATLFSSVPLLLDTITVLLLFFNIFSTAGLQMFSGSLKNRCFDKETGLQLEADLLCGYEPCTNEGEICGKIIENPRWGVVNFDNIFYAFLMVFQCINLQGWSYILLCLIKTYSIYVAIYFIILIFIGAFFLLNLTLAVIKAKFTDNASKNHEISQIGPKISDEAVDIHDLKLIKRLERAHYKRIKQKKAFHHESSDKGQKFSVKMILSDHDMVGLSERIMEQSFRESNEKLINEKKITKIPSKAFPLRELIMKRLLKNNKKMIKNLFLIKQKIPENYEKISTNISVKSPVNNNTLTFAGMQHIYQEKNKFKKNHTKESLRNNNYIHLMQKRGKSMISDTFIEECEKQVPKDIDFKPDISFGSLKTSFNITSMIPEENTQKTEDFVIEDNNMNSEQKIIVEDLEENNIKSMKNINNNHNLGNMTQIYSKNQFSSMKDMNKVFPLPYNNNINMKSLSKTHSFISKNKKFVDSSKKSYEDSNTKQVLQEVHDPNHHFNKEIWEINDDVEIINIFNDPLFKHYYQETGIVLPSALPKFLKFKQNNPINTVIDVNQKDDVEFWMKSPVELKQSTALEKFFKNSVISHNNNIHNVEMVNHWTKKSPLFTKKLSMASPDKPNQLDDFPEKRGTLAGLTTFFMQKKRNNVRDYKIMVDFNKPFRSISETDVLENRINDVQNKKLLEELHKFKKVKYYMIYLQRKKPQDFKNLSFKYHILKLPLKVKKTHRSSSSISEFNYQNIATTKEETKFSQIMAEKKSPLRSPRNRRKYLGNTGDLNKDDLVLTYDNVRRKLKEKFIKEDVKFDMIFNYPDTYLNIMRRDMKERSKSFYNWSGDDVFESQTLNSKLTKFNKIFWVLSTKHQDKLIWLTGFYGHAILAHKLIKNIILSKLMEDFIILIVIFNTIVLSIDGLFNNDDLFRTLNLFFTIIYTIEMGLKIIAFTVHGYLQDKINLFDGLVVALSLAEVIFLEDTNKIKVVKVLRTFRVLRIIRLLRSLKFMNMIIDVLSKTLASFIYIAILLVLFLFIYALLGMKLFGGQFNFPDKEYRQNFDTYNDAFLSVFQILSRSYWFYFVYLMFRSYINHFISALYLISWIFVGNFVFLNLFLAIMLDGFNQTEVEKEELKIEDQDVIDNNSIIIPKPAIKYKSIEAKEPSIEILYNDIICEASFYIFHKQSHFRLICFKISKSHKFENLILFLIVLNTIKMIVDTYIQSSNYMIMTLIDEILTFSFLLETFIKSIALGFILDKGSYLRDTWNIWDFIIVLSSIVDIFTADFTLPFIKVFRVFRTLRPLRFVSHNVNMKIVVNSLLDSVTSIINVIIVIFIIWLMFAILAISLLGGRLGYCDIPDYYGVNQIMCEEMLKEWKVYDTNFDNILYSLNSLFIIGSLEGWPDIMYKCIDSNTADIGPIKDNYSWISYYFIGFILIGAFFLMNLFIGVMFFHFNIAQKNEKCKKNLFLTEDQAKWMDIQKMIAKARPDFKFNRRPNSFFQKYLYTVISSKTFEYFITFTIVLNVIVLAIAYDGSSREYANTLEKLNFTIALIFILDCLLKILTYGLTNYWYNSWNRLDFIVIVCTMIDFLSIIMGNNSLGIGKKLTSVMRFMRVTFILKLIKKFKGINNLVETLIFSLPSLLNVGALLILIYLMYSILGVYLFKNISHGEVIDEYNNFHNFGLAMLILFKCSTGDEWFLIMFDLTKKEPGCEMTDSCGSIAAIFFFLSFFLICSYIMLNLFILIIIQQFEEYHLRVNNPIQTFRENLETFKKIWSEFSQGSEGLNISHRNLIEFYMKLPEPLGFGPGVSRAVIAKEIMNMNLSGDADGNIYFNELLFASMRRVFGAEVLNNAQSEIQILLKREEYAIRKKIEKYKKKDIRKFSFISSRVSSKITSRNSSFFSSLFEKPIPEDFGFRKNIINPIMEFFFVGMAFKSWKKFAILKLDHQLNSHDSLEQKVEDDLVEDESLDKQKIESSESSESSEEEEEDKQKEENDEEPDMNAPPRIPFFQSNYIKNKARARARSILVRGEEKERKTGEQNFFLNLKRRVSNLFMIKPINKIFPDIKP